MGVTKIHVHCKGGGGVQGCGIFERGGGGDVN